MNYKVVSVLVVAILTISQFQVSEASPILEKPGYIFLGKFENTDSTDTGLRAGTTSYYASTDNATHSEALDNCIAIEGQLLTPLNAQHLNNIRLYLETSGQTGAIHFWTAGIQTGNPATTWTWSSTGKPISSITLNGNWADPHNDVDAVGRCLSIFGLLGNFGFCDTTSSWCTNQLRYICEISN